MAEQNDPKFDAVIEELRKNFIESARQKLVGLESRMLELSTGGYDDPDMEADMLRDIHSLKGMGGTFGYPIITAVSHQLEDYIVLVGGLLNRVDDILIFLDCLSDVLDMEADLDDATIARILRDLPTGKIDESGDIVAKTSEVLLIVPNQVLRLLLQHHLENNGCRVVGAGSPFEAFELSVRTLPDLVISSVVLAGLDGIDLLRTLDVMTSTASINLAVLTSSSQDEALLESLPQDTGVISTSETMESDLLKVLKDLHAAD